MWFLGALVRIRASTADTAGAFVLLDERAERGYGASAPARGRRGGLLRPRRRTSEEADGSPAAQGKARWPCCSGGGRTRSSWRTPRRAPRSCTYRVVSTVGSRPAVSTRHRLSTCRRNRKNSPGPPGTTTSNCWGHRCSHDRVDRTTASAVFRSAQQKTSEEAREGLGVEGVAELPRFSQIAVATTTLRSPGVPTGTKARREGSKTMLTSTRTVPFWRETTEPRHRILRLFSTRCSRAQLSAAASERGAEAGGGVL